jgi:hypothetical protein
MVVAAGFVIVWLSIIDSSSAVLTELLELSTVGILGRCSLDSSRVDLSTNSRGGVAQW